MKIEEMKRSIQEKIAELNEQKRRLDRIESLLEEREEIRCELLKAVLDVDNWCIARHNGEPALSFFSEDFLRMCLKNMSAEYTRELESLGYKD